MISDHGCRPQFYDADEMAAGLIFSEGWRSFELCGSCLVLRRVLCSPVTAFQRVRTLSFDLGCVWVPWMCEVGSVVVSCWQRKSRASARVGLV